MYDTANQEALDRYTLVHAAVGYGVGLAGVEWRTAATLASAFELIEDELKTKAPAWFPEPSHDSLINKLTDIGAFLGAYYLATRR